ncbi:Retrotransposable element Tf2 [Ceratobasidium theobromae]|uniref:Retrotransposable element Tf2 n=1 Tax=Ceratobasidium theobromae TaxID=1582974 RepID=A0A5N5Q9L3_9AGAM|nr:Retrotransposable element Tf2 [Ceratobasidium theobromae]
MEFGSTGYDGLDQLREFHATYPAAPKPKDPVPTQATGALKSKVYKHLPHCKSARFALALPASHFSLPNALSNPHSLIPTHKDVPQCRRQLAHYQELLQERGAVSLFDAKGAEEGPGKQQPILRNPLRPNEQGDQDCEEGPDTLVGHTIFRWHHFILFRVSAFSDFVQWHQMGLQVEPTVRALELEIFCQAVGALQLLYLPEEQPEEGHKEEEEQAPKSIEVFVQEEVTVQEEPWAGLAGSEEVSWHMSQVWTGQEEHWDGWGLSPVELRDLERNGVDFEAIAASWTGEVDN